MDAASNVLEHRIPAFRLVDRQLREVDEVIHLALAAPLGVSELSGLLGYFASRSGKLLRPGLVLLSGACFGPTTDEHVQVAAIMELIHSATLLHDDVMDGGQIRRGTATVNCLWGNESAVLLGDFVLSRVFRLIADLDSSRAKVIAETAVHVCTGELRQVMQKRNWDLAEDEYVSIITDKSAAFFSGCCRLGAVLAAAPHDHVEALARYGLHAGIAFQMIDDVMDIVADESETGKTTQNDLSTSKPTLPLIHLLRSVSDSTRDDICAMLDGHCALNGRLRETLDRYGSLGYTRQRAWEHVRKAAEALDPLPEGPAKESLRQTARFLVDRE